MMVSICAGKGSPGATTLTMALAVAWPRPVLVVEMDPYGGDIALRCRASNGQPLSPDTGVLSWSASMTTDAAASSINDHIQVADGDIHVLLGPRNAAQSRAIDRWASMADALACSERDVLIDCGHVSSPSLPSAAAVRQSDQVIVVARAQLDSAYHAQHAHQDIAQMRSTVHGISLVVATNSKVKNNEVHEVIQGLPGLDSVSSQRHWILDAKGAAMISGQKRATRLHRRPLIKSARIIAENLIASNDKKMVDTLAEGAR